MRKALVLPLVAGLAAPAALIAPAQAAQPFPRKAVERAIENQIKDVIKTPATVRCPKRSSWKQGAVFYCKATPKTGGGYRVKVTLGAEKRHEFRWVQVG